MNNSKKYWFPAKKYGWGWGMPQTWQGWVVFVVFISAYSINYKMFNPKDNLSAFIAVSAALIAAFISICLIKGEKTKWRWGNDK